MSSKVTIVHIKQFSTKQFSAIKTLIENQLSSIAFNTEKTIQDKIKESLQRPGSTGNLSRSFFAEKSGARSWGVGSISYLNQHAPYWRWINFGVAATGRTTPPTTVGAFSPGSPSPNAGDFRRGRFQHNSGAGGGFLLTPKKPIQAHNYIARTLIEVPKIISKVLSRIKL